MNIDRGLWRLALVVLCICALVTAAMLWLIAQGPGAQVMSAVRTSAITFALLGMCLANVKSFIYQKIGLNLLVVIVGAGITVVLAGWSSVHVGSDATFNLMMILVALPIVVPCIAISSIIAVRRVVMFIVGGFRS